MLRPYFCAYHSYLENMELLNSEERGRLFTALLEYSKDGTLIPLTGNERFVFPGIRSQIDRDKEQWKKTDEQQASYGRKGGRPRKKTPDGENEKATLLNDADKKGGFSEKGSLFSKSLEKEKKKDMIRLNTTLTKLNDKFDTLDERLTDVSASNHASHRRLWEHEEMQDSKLHDHETRIQILEHGPGCPANHSTKEEYT